MADQQTNGVQRAGRAKLEAKAQAVLIAEAKSRCLREERGCHLDGSDWNGCYICVHRHGLADALRETINQCQNGQGVISAAELYMLADYLDQPSRGED